MAIFWQIFFANLVFVFVLIAVHEVGHYVFGRLAGIPGGQLRIRMLTFPQQVVLRDGDAWVTVGGDLDRYLGVLRRHVPGVGGRFAYVAGGFVFETIFVVAAALAFERAGYRLYPLVLVGLSLTMYLVYLFAMDLPQRRRTGRPWGDTTLLHDLAPRGAYAVTLAMLAARFGLLGWLAFG